MKSAELHDATFDQVRTGLSGRLREVYDAWVRHGPATTRRLADLSTIDLLNVRPRTTDLVGAGLVELARHAQGEGVYRARRQDEWEQWAGRLGGRVRSHHQAI